MTERRSQAAGPKGSAAAGRRMAEVRVATDVPLSAAGNPIGFGKMLRKEDARFLRGKGRFLDDVQLPGMLYGAILRSPDGKRRLVPPPWRS